MISYNKEYFQNNCHFFIKDNGDTISLYYSVGETLSESRKKVTKKLFFDNSYNILSLVLNILIIFSVLSYGNFRFKY